MINCEGFLNNNVGYLSVALIVSDDSGGSSHTIRDHADFAFLPVLPDPVRDVEQQTLKNYTDYDLYIVILRSMKNSERLCTASVYRGKVLTTY